MSEPNDPYEERRHIVAGMLSTTAFTPAEMFPGNMLPLADRVIRYVEQSMQSPDRAEAQPEYETVERDRP